VVSFRVQILFPLVYAVDQSTVGDHHFFNLPCEVLRFGIQPKRAKTRRANLLLGTEEKEKEEEMKRRWELRAVLEGLRLLLRSFPSKI
jgi:hypothetical protein